MAGRDYARPPRDTLIRRLTGGSWLSHYQELSALPRDETGRDGERSALAKNVALLGIADLLQHDETERNSGKRAVHDEVG